MILDKTGDKMSRTSFFIFCATFFLNVDDIKGQLFGNSGTGFFSNFGFGNQQTPQNGFGSARSSAVPAVGNQQGYQQQPNFDYQYGGFQKQKPIFDYQPPAVNYQQLSGVNIPQPENYQPQPIGGYQPQPAGGGQPQSTGGSQQQPAAGGSQQPAAKSCKPRKNKGTPTGSPPNSPQKQRPASSAPTTQRPTSSAPTTQRPTSSAPTTQHPTSSAPQTTKEPSIFEKFFKTLLSSDGKGKGKPKHKTTAAPTTTQKPTTAETSLAGRWRKYFG